MDSITHKTLRSCFYHTLRLRYEEKRFSGGHFEIQYGAGYHGNLSGFLTSNDSTWSKVQTYQLL